MGFMVIAAYLIPMIRGSLLSNAFIGLVASAFYIASIHILWPYNLATFFVGLLIDFVGGVILLMTIRYLTEKGDCSTTCAKFAKAFEFVPAMNIEHQVERTSAFTTLVFGYSILKSLFQSHAHVGLNDFLGKGM